MSQSATGRHARRRQQTRDALVAAARALFEARGFERVRVEDIAAAAGVGRRTFFRYFASKEEVAFPEHRRRLDRFGALMQERLPGEPPMIAVQRALVALGAHLMATRDEVVAQQAIVDASPTLIAGDRARDREWDDAVAAALAGGASPTTRQRVTAGAMMGAIRSTLRVWFEGQGREDLVRMGLETFALLADGLAPGRARAQGPRPTTT